MVRLDVPRVDVCLTETQYEHLQPEKKIGCGTFACAYERPDGKVVKITQDPTDVQTMIEGQGHPRVVQMYEARKLADENLYSVVVEKLDKPSLSFSRMVSQLPLSFLGNNFDEMNRRGRTDEDYFVPGALKFQFVETACSKYSRDQRGSVAPIYGKCMNFATEIVQLHEFFGKKGIRLVDLHHGNFGVNSKGQWAVLDVGFSKSPAPAVKELAKGETI